MYYVLCSSTLILHFLSRFTNTFPLLTTFFVQVLRFCCPVEEFHFLSYVSAYCDGVEHLSFYMAPSECLTGLVFPWQSTLTEHTASSPQPYATSISFKWNFVKQAMTSMTDEQSHRFWISSFDELSSCENTVSQSTHVNLSPLLLLSLQNLSLDCLLVIFLISSPSYFYVPADR